MYVEDLVNFLLNIVGIRFEGQIAATTLNLARLIPEQKTQNKKQ